MSLDVLLQLVLLLAPLSLVGVGGAFTIIPEIHRQSVEVYGWLTDAEFAQLFALAQASPGPNLLVVSLIGWHVAGLVGALVGMIAVCLPSSLVTFAIAHASGRVLSPELQLRIQRGLAPVAIGLVLASVVVLAQAADTSPQAYLVTTAAVLLTLRTNVHPLLLMALAGGLAIAGWL